MSKLGNIGARLYRGEVGYDFIGKRKIWYGISILITITAIVGLAVRGLNMGIEFSGGAVFTTPKTSVSSSEAEHKAEAAAEGHQAVVQSSATAVCASRSASWTPNSPCRCRRPWPRT